MFKFNRVVCSVLVCGLASLAYGDDNEVEVEVDDVYPVGAGLIENPEAEGEGELEYKAELGMTEVEAEIEDFLPYTTYTVDVMTLFGGPTLLITTDDEGEGEMETMVPFDLTDGGTLCAKVTVYLDANGDFFPQADEIRAIGFSEGGLLCPE